MIGKDSIDLKVNELIKIGFDFKIEDSGKSLLSGNPTYFLYLNGERIDHSKYFDAMESGEVYEYLKGVLKGIELTKEREINKDV